MTSATTSAVGIRWDLQRYFYAAADDPALMRDMDAAATAAEQFAATYRGTINVPGGPSAEHLAAALQQLEAIYEQGGRAQVYAHLLFAGDTSKSAHRDLLQKVDQRATAINNQILFFDLEWLQVADEDAEGLLAAPALQRYHYYLESARRYRPHMLSEAEERMVNEKDQIGQQAWQRFFTEQTASLRFPIERDGEMQHMELDGILSQLYRPDREVRRNAFETLYDVLSGQAEIRAFIYNTLLQDQVTMNRLRQYDAPMLSRHLSNQIDPHAVDTMMEVVEANYGIAHRYFTLKAKLLDVPKLELYDQYAPVIPPKGSRTYAEAQTTVLTAMERFNPEFRTLAEGFFSESRIDAELRPGKRGGAFCSGFAPSSAPYVLLNYTDELRDVMTMAHELGHGIHFELAREQTLLNYYPVLPLAETASVFAEMLVFDYLVSQVDSPQTRLALVCSKIEDIFATVFRQNVLTRFELAAYDGSMAGRVTPEQFGQHWLAANQPYYGDAVNLTDGYEYGWSYIPHFINTPFYCYSYVFGELLVLALYGMYREQGAAFVPHYRALLAAGGSASPEALLAPLGVDIRAAAFWQRGLDELRRLVDQAEQLAVQ